MPHTGSLRRLSGNLEFLGADQGIQHSVHHGHPLPRRAVRNRVGYDDFVFDFAGSRVDQFARVVIGQVESVGRGDHRVAMDHEALGQRSFPQNRTVVGIGADQRVQHRVLVCLVRNVSEGSKDPAAGRYGDFGHGAELRIG